MDQFRDIASKHVENSTFANLNKTENLHQAFQKLNQLKQDHKSEPDKIIYDLNNIELTDEDRNLGLPNDEVLDDIKTNISKQFEIAFGTALDDHSADIPKPYIQFDLPIDEQRRQLNDQILKRNAKKIDEMLTLTDDIEQKFSISPFRISRRKLKKIRAEQQKQSLEKWFNMPRVEEITKEQEKDLLALKMRRVWNPKQFYKKSSQITAGNGNGLDDRSKYFQIGTIQETQSDYFSGRLTKRERKQTIVDELMQDVQLQAYNKRKIQYAMTKNSRLKIMMRRAKMRRIKRRERERKDEKAQRFKDGATRSNPHRNLNKFKTFEI